MRGSLIDLIKISVETESKRQTEQINFQERQKKFKEKKNEKKEK